MKAQFLNRVKRRWAKALDQELAEPVEIVEREFCDRERPCSLHSSK